MSYSRDFNQNQPEEKESIFENIQTLEEASKGTRFVNYIIDVIVSQIIFYSFMFLLIAINENILDFFPALTIFLVLGFNFLYYFLFETYANGKTIGKFATGTRVVTIDDETPDAGTIAIRSLCRYIPFNPLSFLGETGWHDSLSKTRVVKS